MKILPITLGFALIASPAFAIRPFPPHPMPTETQRASEPSMQDQINAMSVAVNQIVMRMAGQIEADQQVIDGLRAEIAKSKENAVLPTKSVVPPVAASKKD